MEIRPFSAGDGEVFARFCASLSDRTQYFFLPHPLDRATALSLTSPAALSDADTRRFMAVEDGEMAGYYFFRFFSAPLPIFAVGVRDDRQNRGVGRAMVLHALEIARAAGKDGVRLTTFKDNCRAQHLYRACGYIVKGTDEATGEWELYFMFDGRPLPRLWREGAPEY